jgi:outer membrane immunogenic protein
MKRCTALSLASFMIVTSAAAADMPVLLQAPTPPPAVLWSWTGLYIGGNGGWIGSADGGRVANTGTDTGAGGLGTLLNLSVIQSQVNLPISGFLGGAEIGYNLQFGPHWVVGVEADLGGEVGGSNTLSSSVVGKSVGLLPPAGVITTVFNRELNQLATVRGRLGYAVAPDQLWYVTAGMSYATTKLGATFSCNAICTGSAATSTASVLTSNSSVGWVIGAGIEWKFLPSWSAKVEYLYIDAGSPTSTLVYAYPKNTSTLTSTFTETDNVVRVGVNYKLF